MLLITAALGGCSVRDIYAGIYETLRFQRERETLPQERAHAEPTPSFNQYDAARQQLLGSKPQGPGDR